MQQRQNALPARLVAFKIRDCSTGQVSLQVYDGEVREGRYEAKSMLDQATGRCCEYRKHLESRIFSQICLGTPDKAVSLITIPKIKMQFLIQSYLFEVAFPCMQN